MTHDMTYSENSKKKNPKSRISPFEPNIIDRQEMKGSQDWSQLVSIRVMEFMFLFIFLVEDLQRWTKQVVKACLYRNFKERERERK